MERDPRKGFFKREAQRRSSARGLEGQDLASVPQKLKEGTDLKTPDWQALLQKESSGGSSREGAIDESAFLRIWAEVEAALEVKKDRSSSAELRNAFALVLIPEVSAKGDCGLANVDSCLQRLPGLWSCRDELPNISSRLENADLELFNRLLKGSATETSTAPALPRSILHGLWEEIKSEKRTAQRTKETARQIAKLFAATAGQLKHTEALSATKAKEVFEAFLLRQGALEEDIKKGEFVVYFTVTWQWSVKAEIYSKMVNAAVVLEARQKEERERNKEEERKQQEQRDISEREEAALVAVATSEAKDLQVLRRLSIQKGLTLREAKHRSSKELESWLQEEEERHQRRQSEVLRRTSKLVKHVEESRDSQEVDKVEDEDEAIERNRSRSISASARRRRERRGVVASFDARLKPKVRPDKSPKQEAEETAVDSNLPASPALSAFSFSEALAVEEVVKADEGDFDGFDVGEARKDDGEDVKGKIEWADQLSDGESLDGNGGAAVTAGMPFAGSRFDQLVEGSRFLEGSSCRREDQGSSWISAVALGMGQDTISGLKAENDADRRLLRILEGPYASIAHRSLPSTEAFAQTPHPATSSTATIGISAMLNSSLPPPIQNAVQHQQQHQQHHQPQQDHQQLQQGHQHQRQQHQYPHKQHDGLRWLPDFDTFQRFLCVQGEPKLQWLASEMMMIELPLGTFYLDPMSLEFQTLDTHSSCPKPAPILAFGKLPCGCLGGPLGPLNQQEKDDNDVDEGEVEIFYEHPYQEAFNHAAALALLADSMPQQIKPLLHVAEEAWTQEYGEAISACEDPASPVVQQSKWRQSVKDLRQHLLREMQVGCQLIAKLRSR
eukprot:TRINITY_DN10712_c0_g1_i2.p1 TRINITY_DN10712_c0_g1~~TRINITY_DN10712_c0_g1_i2.p1  ORF type:complete len:844 (-),score=195.30 TRINITY_DN10712_c0_g1_i2:109-2640(-)